MHVEKQKRIILSLSETEASVLKAIAAFVPVGVVPFADDLCNDLDKVGVAEHSASLSALNNALVMK